MLFSTVECISANFHNCSNIGTTFNSYGVGDLLHGPLLQTFIYGVGYLLFSTVDYKHSIPRSYSANRVWH